jgi:hypothetical protein
MRAWKQTRMYLVGVITGMVLLVGGQALADIPDARPSAPDSSHTFYGCVSKTGTGSNGQIRPMTALDKSLGNCPTSHIEVRLVPSALP